MRTEETQQNKLVQRRIKERRKVSDRRQMLRFESVGRRSIGDRRSNLNVEARIRSV